MKRLQRDVGRAAIILAAAMGATNQQTVPTHGPDGDGDYCTLAAAWVRTFSATGLSSVRPR